MTRDMNTPLFEAASAMHEMYQTLVDAGFTEKQAMEIVGIILSSLFKGGA